MESFLTRVVLEHVPKYRVESRLPSAPRNSYHIISITDKIRYPGRLRVNDIKDLRKHGNG